MLIWNDPKTLDFINSPDFEVKAESTFSDITRLMETNQSLKLSAKGLAINLPFKDLFVRSFYECFDPIGEGVFSFINFTY